MKFTRRYQSVEQMRLEKEANVVVKFAIAFTVLIAALAVFQASIVTNKAVSAAARSAEIQDLYTIAGIMIAIVLSISAGFIGIILVRSFIYQRTKEIIAYRDEVNAREISEALRKSKDLVEAHRIQLQEDAAREKLAWQKARKE